MDRRDIYAHRGLWGGDVSQNSSQAIQAALDLGFSVETDVRVLGNRLVISHDSPGPEALDFENISGMQGSFAFNIKEDGLADYAENFTDFLLKSNSFFFDGSVPDIYCFKQKGIPHALRLSEFENTVPWTSPFIWVDSFDLEWWNLKDLIQQYSSTSKMIFVSPELHGRSHLQMWNNLSALITDPVSNIGICTDYPEKFFEILEL